MVKGKGIHIPYTVTRIGKRGEVRYLHLSARLKALGVTPKKLGLEKTVIGPENADTRKRARQLQSRCEAILTGEEKLQTYTPGSFGQLFAGYMRAQAKRLERKDIKRRTYEEFEYVYRAHLEARIGETPLHRLTVSLLTDLKYTLEDEHSVSVRHKVMTKLSMILRYAVINKVLDVNPCEAIPNPAPKRRRQFWLPKEWEQLVNAAPPSLALVMRIMYETARNPVDAHQLPFDALRRDRHGPYIDRAREKTGEEGMQQISETLFADLKAYHDALPFAVMPGQPFLMRPVARKFGSRMQAWRDESEFAKDFRRVRIAVFGKAEQRTAKDIRKTANLEMSIGGARPEERAAVLANAVHRNKALDEVYTPPTLIAARKANQTREKGREALEAMARDQNEKQTG